MEQTNPKSTIEILSEHTRIYGVPPQLFYDDVCQRISNALDRIQKIKNEIKTKKEFEAEFLTNDSYGRGHRTKKRSEISNENETRIAYFITPDQKKQVTDALVAFVLAITNDSHIMERSEAMALPAVLDFLMKTDSPEGINITFGDEIIGSTTLPDLYKITKKFAESKE